MTVSFTEIKQIRNIRWMSCNEMQKKLKIPSGIIRVNSCVDFKTIPHVGKGLQNHTGYSETIPW